MRYRLTVYDGNVTLSYETNKADDLINQLEDFKLNEPKKKCKAGETCTRPLTPYEICINTPKKYIEEKLNMENILKALNGKQLGDKYCFSVNGTKFTATLDYDGVVDYGWRNLIRVRSVDGKHSNTFKFKLGSYRDGQVKYYDNSLDRFVIVTDFSTLVQEIVDWVDYIAE